MSRILFVVVLLGLLTACCESPVDQTGDLNSYTSLEDTLKLPFDTARVLGLYKMPVSDFAKNLPDDLDTFDLVDVMYACDCPSWATKYELEHEESYHPLDPETNSSHDVFYIESVDDDLQLPDAFGGFRNTIRFYGKVRTRSGHPRVGNFSPGPPAGPVLTIYGYEVILPAFIYGPFVHVPDTTGKMPDFMQYEMTRLVVTGKNYHPGKARKGM